MRGVAIQEHSVFPHLPATPAQTERIAAVLADVEAMLA